MASGTSYMLGAGFAVEKVSVPLTVSSISHVTSSAAGGLTVTLTGLGFSTNISDIAVTFHADGIAYEGRVLSASEHSISVRTPRVLEAIDEPVTLDVSVTPSWGATPQPTGFAMAFEAGLTPRVVSVSPNRGSTAGGTMITVSVDGSGPELEGDASEYTVTVGDNGQLCGDVQISNDRRCLTCVTAAPSPREFAPQVLYVLR